MKDNSMNTYKRIGGWLVLLGIQLIITIIQALLNLKSYLDLFTSNEWLSITTYEKSNYIKSVFIYESFLNGYILIGGLFVLFQFIQQKRIFRNYYSIYMLLIFIGFLIAYFLTDRSAAFKSDKLSQIEIAIFAYLIWSVIWINYLFKGKRPQLTFTS